MADPTVCALNLFSWSAGSVKSLSIHSPDECASKVVTITRRSLVEGDCNTTTPQSAKAGAVAAITASRSAYFDLKNGLVRSFLIGLKFLRASAIAPTTWPKLGDRRSGLCSISCSWSTGTPAGVAGSPNPPRSNPKSIPINSFLPFLLWLTADCQLLIASLSQVEQQPSPVADRLRGIALRPSRNCSSVTFTVSDFGRCCVHGPMLIRLSRSHGPSVKFSGHRYAPSSSSACLDTFWPFTQYGATARCPTVTSVFRLKLSSSPVQPLLKQFLRA